MKIVGLLSMLCLLLEGCASYKSGESKVYYGAREITLDDAPQARRKRTQKEYTDAVDLGDVFTKNLGEIDKAVIYRVKDSETIAPGRENNFLVTFMRRYEEETGGQGKGFPILDVRTLQADALGGLLGAWRAQTLGCVFWESAGGCFSPRHVARFYIKDQLVLEAIICFSCRQMLLEIHGNRGGACAILSRDEVQRRLHREFFALLPEPGRPPAISALTGNTKSLVETLSQHWESPELNELFSLEQRGRIAANTKKVIADCYRLRPNDKAARSAEFRAEYTIPGVLPEATSAAQPMVLEEVAVTDISVRFTPEDPELQACARDRIGLLHFLRSKRGPLRIRVRF